MRNLSTNKCMVYKILSSVFVTLVLFLGAFFWNKLSLQTTRDTVPLQFVSATSVSQSKYKHSRIADIKVGDRVVVSTNDTPRHTAVDPATWKKVVLYAEETWYDDTIDTINIEYLASPDWMAQYDAQVGKMVPIPLDLEEMGLDVGILARIQAIEECPEIRAGPGRVVLTTVNHLSRGVCELTYSTADGRKETIKPTASHRFYSLDRNQWIPISDVNFGERLQGLGANVLTVQSCQLRGTTERVYNMTVEEDHVYQVGYLNLLAHNNCLEDVKDVVLFRAPQRSQANPEHVILDGFSAEAGGMVHFATVREISESFQNQGPYSNGLFEVSIPKEKFDEFVANGILVADGYYPPKQSYYVPESKLKDFNDAISGLTYTPQ